MAAKDVIFGGEARARMVEGVNICLLYTSDAADG